MNIKIGNLCFDTAVLKQNQSRFTAWASFIGKPHRNTHYFFFWIGKSVHTIMVTRSWGNSKLRGIYFLKNNEPRDIIIRFHLNDLSSPHTFWIMTRWFDIVTFLGA